jgi:hypothetical protein
VISVSPQPGETAPRGLSPRRDCKLRRGKLRRGPGGTGCRHGRAPVGGVRQIEGHASSASPVRMDARGRVHPTGRRITLGWACAGNGFARRPLCRCGKAVPGRGTVRVASASIPPPPEGEASTLLGARRTPSQWAGSWDSRHLRRRYATKRTAQTSSVAEGRTAGKDVRGDRRTGSLRLSAR